MSDRKITDQVVQYHDKEYYENTIRRDIFLEYFKPEQKKCREIAKKMKDKNDLDELKSSKYWSINSFADAIGCSLATLKRFLAEHLTDQGDFNLANRIAYHLGGQELFNNIVPDIKLRIDGLASEWDEFRINEELENRDFDDYI